jgi:hypothetical protein
MDYSYLLTMVFVVLILGFIAVVYEHVTARVWLKYPRMRNQLRLV